MGLGKKITDLRKEIKMSQEELAEKVGVARQTISKWELEETSPDIKQAQELSRIFNISLDELVGNEINNIVVEKISNTEKLAGMIIKILKGAGIVLIAMIVIEMVVLISAIIFYRPVSKNVDRIDTIERAELTCRVDNEKYVIEIESNGLFNCKNCEKEMNDDLEELIEFNDITATKNKIMEYFEDSKINCELKEY
ncbi:MAG: helix-turn-helix domain-containing protein [Bacilli bacterium]|nr:helix-turn-helix domain-containing protein [Bacilli bacterium]